MIMNAAPITFFQGVVEENNDPLGNGRVQVRVFGIHPPYDSNLVDTADLPWAILLNGTYGALHRVPDIGEWVMGLSLDGSDHLNLLVLGVIPGMQRSSPSGASFAPNQYLKPNIDPIRKMGNPPIPPQMTGEDLEHTPILNNTGIDIASGGITPDKEGFAEPTTPTNGNPQDTTVWNASYSGSFMEINDSSDNGYINIVHHSGTGITIDNSGTIKIKSLGDDWKVSAGHSKEYVAGRKDIVVESGNYTVHAAGGDILMTALGDISINSHGDMNLSAAGKITMNAGTGIEAVGPKVGLYALSDNVELKAPNMVLIEGGEAIVEKTAIKSTAVSGDMSAQIGGAYSVASESFSASGGGNLGFDYGEIHLNGGESSSPVIVEAAIKDANVSEPPTPMTKTGTNIPASTGSLSGFDIDSEDMA